MQHESQMGRMGPKSESTTGNDVLDLERLELALRASNEGIWDWNVGSEEIYYSGRILEFLECTAEDAPNLFLPPLDWVHPDDRPKFESTLRASMEDESCEILAIDTRIKKRSGEWRWFRIRGALVRDEAGMVKRIAGSIIDISLRKQAEAKLEDERHLLKQLIDHIPVQVYFKDVKSRFVMANQGMAEWMGLKDAADLIGKHDRDFFEESHWKLAELDERKIMLEGEAVANQLEREEWRQGEETWVLTSKFPWRDRHGHVRGTFGVSSDVTRLVIAEREASKLAKIVQSKNEIYEEELVLAREIQTALTSQDMPAIRSDHGEIQFVSKYDPATDLAGDFYQVLELKNDCVGVLICDVMGHGVRSALVVAMMRGLLEKQSGVVTQPGEYLASLNEGLVGILDKAGVTMFATAFFAVIDLAEKRIDYACAGHPGPLIRGRTGIQQLASAKGMKGPGLGLMQGAAYPCHRVSLLDVDEMYLFTDGVLEIDNAAGEQFCERRLLEVIEQQGGCGLEETIEAIIDSALNHSKTGEFEDDVCVLGVKIALKETRAEGRE